MEYRIIANRYKIIKQLGEGAMGRVYKAFDIETQRVIAIKEFSPRQMTSTELDNFKAEFSSLARLRHPNLVEVYDFGVDDGIPYFTMEFVEGRNLITMFNTLSTDKIYAVIVQVAWALAYIHSRGIIHHDVNTSNIMIAKDDFSQVKLMDFGLARERSSRIEIMIRGTVEYMAPELVREVPIDHRVDLYSLGIVMYELATGQLPFKGDNKIACIKKHLEETPRPPQLINADVPIGMEKIILKLMEKDPNDRYVTADEVIQAIADITGEEIRSESQESMVSYVISSKLVGREREMAQLLNQLERLNSKTLDRSLVLLEGENGVGKKRLIKEFKTHCQLEQVPFFQATCHQEQSGVYQSMSDLIRQLINYTFRQDAAKCRKYLRKFGPELSLLLPNLAKDYDVPVVVHHSEADDQLWLMDAITQFFLGLASEFAYVLSIINIQWIDPQSLKCLHYLIRNISQQGPLVCATFTVEKVDFETMQRISSNLLRDRVYVRLHLTNFDRETVGVLLRSMFGTDKFPDHFIDQIHQETNGNPEYIVTIIKTMIEERIIHRANGQWQIRHFDLSRLGLPADIAQIIQRRLEYLPEQDRALLDMLMVANYPLEIPQLRHLLELSHEAIADSLQRLLYFELIAKAESFNIARFHVLNEKTRQFLYEQMNADTRRELHRHIGLKMEVFHRSELDQYAEKLAHHFSQAGEAAKTVVFSTRAGKKALSLFASREAVRHFERALSCLATASMTPERADIMLHLGRAHVLLAQYEQALAVYDELETALKKADLDRELRGTVFYEKSKVFSEQGDYEQALALLRRVNRTVKQPNSVVVGRTFSEMSRLYKLLGRYKNAKEYCQRSFDILKNSNRPDDMAMLHAQQGDLASMRNQWEQALEWYQEALRQVRETGNLLLQNDFANRIGDIYFRQNDYKKSLIYTRDSLETAEKLQHPRLISRSLNNLGILYYRTARFLEAVNCWVSALDTAVRIGNSIVQSTLNFNLGEMMATNGKFDKALEYYQRSLELQRRMSNPAGLVRRLFALADLYVQLNAKDQARSYLKEVLSFKNQDNNPVIQCYRQFSQAMMVMLLDDPQSAISHLERSAEFAQKHHQHKLHQKVIMRQIELYQLLGQYDEAHRRTTHLLQRNSQVDFEFQIYALYQSGWLDWTWKKKPRHALTHLHNALRMARQFNFGRYMWLCNGLIGQIHLSQKNIEEAHTHLVNADEIIHRLAGNISSDTLRSQYLSDPTKHQIGQQYRQARQLYQEQQQKSRQKRDNQLDRLIEGDEQHQGLRTLRPILKAITATVDLETLLERILDSLIEMTSLERGVIYLRNHQGQMEIALARHADHYNMQIENGEWIQDLVDEAAQTRQIRVFECQPSKPESAEKSTAPLSEIAIALPLLIDTMAIGVVYVDSAHTKRTFAEKELALLQVLGDEMAIMIENARQFEDLQQANAKLMRTIKELSEADLMKSRFINNVTHEIRTPLTSIIAYSDMLVERPETISDEMRVKFINVIQSESHRLLGIVNKILRTSVLERSDLARSLQVIQTYDFINVLIEKCHQRCAEIGLVFLYEIEPELPNIFGSAEELTEGFEHLFDNAAKFTDCPGEIMFKVEKTGQQTVRFMLTDTGRGIKKEDLDRVFLRFFQSGNILTEKPAGTGLGLAIARRIFQNHQGRIWVESELGQGSTFYVELPYMDDYSLLLQKLESAGEG